MTKTCFQWILGTLFISQLAAAQSIEKCTYTNGVINMPNYVYSLYITDTTTVKNITLPASPSGSALNAVFSYDNPGAGACGYGSGADRCGTSIPLTDNAGGGYIMNPGVLGMRTISGTAMTGLKVGARVANTTVGVGLCSQ